MRLKVEVDCSDGLVRRMLLGVVRAARRGGASISRMDTARVATGGRGQDAPAVLHRMEAEKTPLAQALDLYAADMRRRGKRPRSIKQFRTAIERAAGAAGWTTPEQITYRAVTDWLSAHQSDGSWAGNTADGVLSAFRSFTRFAAVSGILPKDPLYGAAGSGEGDGPGARAATTDELRTLLELTHARERSDKRAAKSYPFLHRTALALTLGRFCEPGGAETCGAERFPRGWRWGDLRLGESVPCIVWGPEMHKNRARVTLPLHPTLAAMLTAHRERVPHGDADPVFPIRPTRAALRADIDRCGFPDAFSAHSFRKWARTSLVEAGVQADLVDILMRHQTLAGRYTMPSQVTLAQALTALPQVVPITVDERFSRDSVQKPLTRADDVGYRQDATRQSDLGTRKTTSRTAPAPPAKITRVATSVQTGARGPSFPAGQLPKRAKESSPKIVPRMPKCAFQGRVDSIADWLEVTARLIRSLDRGNEQQTED